MVRAHCDLSSIFLALDFLQHSLLQHLMHQQIETVIGMGYRFID